ncbi:MAG: extracellular solute-binding protein [Candidatus Izimaplasma sp.]|nr:extracellular solute-binding protein [Candidatus Izimaplasma bacterium]
MKKLLLLSSVLLIALTLTGCNPSTDVDPDPDPSVCTNNAANGTLYEFDKNQTEVVTIKVWLDDEAYATALIDAFEALYPDIKVEWEQVGSVDTRQRLETYSGSEYAADVVVFPHDHIGAALNSNLLYPFPDSQREDLIDRMVSSAIGTATSCYDSENNVAVACGGAFESELFGAPLSGESVALFYNRTLLESIDDTKTYPEATWEEIIASALNYNQSLVIDDPATADIDESQEQKLYFALDVGNAYDMHFVSTSFGFDLFGVDHLDKASANLGSTAMINALTWLNGTLRPAVLNLNNSSLEGEANRTLFETGELAYIIDGPWSIQRYKEGSELNTFDWGVAKIPTINGVQPVTFSGVQIAAVSKGTSEPTAAFKFVEFMTSDEGLAILYAETNKLPALKDVSTVEGVATDVYLSGISAQLAYSHPMPIIPEMGYFWSNAGTMYSSAWNGTATPAEAAETAQTGFESQANIS